MLSTELELKLHIKEMRVCILLTYRLYLWYWINEIEKVMQIHYISHNAWLQHEHKQMHSFLWEPASWFEAGIFLYFQPKMFLNCSYFIMVWKSIFTIICVNCCKFWLCWPSDMLVCCQSACFVIICQSDSYFV